MFKKKGFGIAIACFMALGAWSGSALATPVTVGGVTWDPASPLDVTIQALNFRESSVDTVGDVLQGYGKIGTLNGPGESVFCPGCDLTFVFQYTVSHIGGTATNPKVVFTGGSIDFYVDNGETFNVLDPSTAGVGLLWLSLSGHAAPYTGFSTIGELYSSISGPIGSPNIGSFGFGMLDVTGGLAHMNFDTNSKTDGADFELVSSFQNNPAGICQGNICYPISGTGQLLGASVPEPGEIGLLGLGLGMLGLLIRRRYKEAEKHS